jgi:hypothetical protein
MLKLFSKRAAAPQHKQRAPRDPMRCSATICVEDGFHRAELSDISKSGCKVTLDAPQPPGRTVQIALENFHSLSGTVRWCRDGVAGIQFSNPLSDAALAKWKHAIATGKPTDGGAPSRPRGRRDFWGNRLG